MSQSSLNASNFDEPNEIDGNVNANDDDSVSLGEMLSERYWGISAYLVIMLSLAGAIIWTAVAIAEQVQQHHADYTTLQTLQEESHALEVEHQRLIIEQQTFSATPQIASRAVSQMGMFSPKTEDKLILQPTASQDNANVTQNVALGGEQ